MTTLNENNDMEEFEDIPEPPRLGSRQTRPKLSFETAGDDKRPIDLSSEQIEQNAKMWSVAGHAYFPSEYSVNSLPPGYYTVDQSDRGTFFYKHPMNLDDLMILPDSASEDILSHIEFFWTREERFRELGFLWKRGILLHGPAGGGKTCTLQLLSKSIIEKGGISIYLKNPHITAHGLQLLRRIEPDRPIIVLLEDLDALIQDYGESKILAVLDGEMQIDNVVFIATTNYPENLDKRLINRPSRFDKVQFIGMPKSAARKIYLETKNPRLRNSSTELKKWVRESKGFSIAHLKEMILAVEVLDEELDDVINRLKKMMTMKPTSEYHEERSFGFVNNNG